MTPSIHATSFGTAPPDDLVLDAVEARLFPSWLRHGLTTHGLVLAGERALPVVRCLAGRLAGHGEAPPLPSFTGEGATATLRGLERAAPSLRGLPVVAALERLHKADFASPPVRAALDVALHDLWAQSLATPLHGVLGPQHCHEVRISRAIGYHPPARTIEIALGYVEAGVSALKLKVGRDPDVDARTLLALRKAVGDSIELAADANGGYDEASARCFLVGSKRANLAYLEQPLPRGDLAGARRLRRLGIPIVLDEGAFDADDVERIGSEKAADAVAIKLIKCGGLRPALAMASAAAETGMTVLVVDPLGSAISLDAGLHLAAVLPEISFAHGLSAGLEVTAPHAPHRPVAQGRLRVPDDPGLGATVAWPLRDNR